MGGARYISQTSGDVGWGNSTHTWSSPTMFSGDMGLANTRAPDGRSEDVIVEWPNGTYATEASHTPSLNNSGTARSKWSYTHTPDVGVNTVGANRGVYQCRADAVRVSGVLPLAETYAYQAQGNGVGGGGSWVHEVVTGNINSPYALVMSAYGVQAFNSPGPNVGPSGQQTLIRRGAMGEASGRGHAIGYSMEDVVADDTPLHAWNWGSTAGTYSTGCALTGWNGVIGGLRGIIIMQFKTLMDELKLGLIPPWRYKEAWDYYFGHLPPIGTPILSASWMEKGKLVEFHSPETIALNGYRRADGSLFAVATPAEIWRQLDGKRLRRYSRRTEIERLNHSLQRSRRGSSRSPVFA